MRASPGCIARREARISLASCPLSSDIAIAMKSDIRSILKLEVPLIVRIAERAMHVDEVVQWVPGMIIEMGKNADEELELLVNNVPVGCGSAVKITENFGIRISYVGDLRARIDAISGRATSSEGEPAVGASEVDGKAGGGAEGESAPPRASASASRAH